MGPLKVAYTATLSAILVDAVYVQNSWYPTVKVKVENPGTVCPCAAQVKIQYHARFDVHLQEGYKQIKFMRKIALSTEVGIATK
jgi:hypothetical protein